MKQPVWIEEAEALVLHERLLSLDPGASGVRDLGLLKSALARPRHAFAYTENVDIFALSAIYTGGVVRNHPFIDGNKRIGFLIGVLFLELNGYHFSADEESVAQAVIALAGGTLNEQGYTRFLRDHARRK